MVARFLLSWFCVRSSDESWRAGWRYSAAQLKATLYREEGSRMESASSKLGHRASASTMEEAPQLNRPITQSGTELRADLKHPMRKPAATIMFSARRCGRRQHHAPLCDPTQKLVLPLRRCKLAWAGGGWSRRRIVWWRSTPDGVNYGNFSRSHNRIRCAHTPFFIAPDAVPTWRRCGDFQCVIKRLHEPGIYCLGQ